jgi:hypothetical protein
MRSASTGPCPDRMAANQRLREVISLLAAGFLRSRATHTVDGGEKDLDVPRTPSDVCPNLGPRGRAHECPEADR